MIDTIFTSFGYGVFIFLLILVIGKWLGFVEITFGKDIDDK